MHMVLQQNAAYSTQVHLELNVSYISSSSEFNHAATVCTLTMETLYIVIQYVTIITPELTHNRHMHLQDGRI